MNTISMHLLRTRFAAALLLSACGPALGQSSYHGYLRFLGDSLDEATTVWSNDAQGLAHDQSNWFVTNNDGDIWKIPLSQDLCCAQPDENGVSVVYIEDIPALAGYQKFKDPVGHLHGGIWYLFVPVSGEGLETTVAVFRADTLEYLDHQTFVNANGPPVGGAIFDSWCATNPAEHLFLPYQFAGPSSGVIEYAIDWTALTAPQPQLVATFVLTIHLLDDEGFWLFFENPQGGEFSLDGRLLYTVTGYLDDSDEEVVSEGIHAFDTTTWLRVAHSENGTGLFNYAWDPGTLTAEEPQGVTVWDLDGSGAPGPGGQMHVLMLDNDCGCSCPPPLGDCDDVYIKHYTNRIWVNAAAEPGVGNGTLFAPYATVGEAAALAWDGCEIQIGPGSYDEYVFINQRAKLVATAGPVVIGN